MLHMAANEMKQAKKAQVTQQQPNKTKEANSPTQILKPAPAAPKPVYKPPKQE